MPLKLKVNLCYTVERSREKEMKISVISPILKPTGIDHRVGFRKRDCSAIPAEFEFFYNDAGPEFLVNEYDDVYSAPHLLKNVVQAEKDGFEAVVINCSADTALHACREAVSIPVVGPSEAAMHYAAQFVNQFIVLTFSSKTKNRFERIAREAHLQDKLHSVESVEMDFHQLSNGSDLVAQTLCDTIETLYNNTGCDGFLLGCTDFEDVAPELRNKLAEKNVDVQVFRPFEIAAWQAYTTVQMGHIQGRTSYPKAEK